MDISRKTLMRRAGLLKEGRITFNGTKADQLYRIIKDDENAMVFANGKQYGVDAEEMRHDLQNPVIIGYDEDGGEHDIRVADIEFIEL